LGRVKEPEAVIRVSDPLVSVLLPVFDAQATLVEALASLEAQSLQDFEIVAVDDGSGDRSPEILATWHDPRLRVLPGAHEGLVPTLNRGLSQCRGQYVARMDADDIADPRRLEKQIRVFVEHPETSVVSCLVRTFPRQSVGEGFRIYENWLNQLVIHEDICREIFIESPIPHPSAVFGREEVTALGGYEEHGWPEDYDLWLRYFMAGRRFAKVPEVLLSWREHPARLTHTDSRYSVENFLRAKAHYLLQGPLKDRNAIFVWGAGKTGRRLSKHLIRGGCTPEAFIDIAAHRIGGTLRGVPIIAVEDLPDLWAHARQPFLLAAVASRGARGSIRRHLRDTGLTEGEQYLCVA